MGGGGGGFLTSRGTANVLTRTTAILAAVFFVDQPGPVDPGRLGPQAALDPAGHRRAGRAGLAAGQSGRQPRRSRPAGVLDRLAAGAGARGAAGAAVESKFPQERPANPASSAFGCSRYGLVESNSRELKVGPHGAVRLHHRRRGLLPRQGSRFGGARRAAAGARLQGPAAQARPLSQRRSRHDVAVSARRGVRHRRRRRDRSRPRPLRALHRQRRRASRTTSPPAASIRTSSPRSGAATISAPPSR